MELNPTSEQSNSFYAAKALQDFEEAHKDELAAIMDVLVKLTRRSPAQIKPHLETMLEHLVESQERPFSETATPEERARAFREWASGHERNTPLLSDYAVSRESMYDDERL